MSESATVAEADSDGSQLAVVANHQRAIAVCTYPSLEQNPAAVYLAHLKPTGRRSRRQALYVIAARLTSDQADALICPRHLPRFQHTTAIRAQLSDSYKPATANKIRTFAWPGCNAAPALGDWLALWGLDAGPLFWPLDYTGKLHPRRLTAQSIYNLLRKRAK